MLSISCKTSPEIACWALGALWHRKYQSLRPEHGYGFVAWEHLGSVHLQPGHRYFICCLPHPLHVRTFKKSASVSAQRRLKFSLCQEDNNVTIPISHSVSGHGSRSFRRFPSSPVGKRGLKSHLGKQQAGAQVPVLSEKIAHLQNAEKSGLNLHC